MLQKAYQDSTHNAGLHKQEGIWDKLEEWLLRVGKVASGKCIEARFIPVYLQLLQRTTAIYSFQCT